MAYKRGGVDLSLDWKRRRHLVCLVTKTISGIKLQIVVFNKNPNKVETKVKKNITICKKKNKKNVWKFADCTETTQESS